MTINRCSLTTVLVIALVCGVAMAGEPGTPLYRDASQPIDKRIDDLLGRMTLEEKIGQMNMPCVYVSELGNTIPAKTEAVQKFAAGTLLEEFGPGGGFFTLPNTILHEGPRQQAEFFNRLQRLVKEQTRLGIPLLQSEEGTHGLMCPAPRSSPKGPALGSTWNMDLLSRVYATAAREARSIGVHQIFTLVVEPIRDPRLGRNQEAFSEDPFLCSRIAETIARSVQGDNPAAADKVVSGLCHYPGQSQPVSGLERGAMEISERSLREVFLPPWQAGSSNGGALGVMATYPAVDAVPTHASHKILTSILREELGFDGLVLSEGGGIGTLVYEGLARPRRKRGQLALAAGVDVGISFESGYMHDLLDSVRRGKVPKAWSTAVCGGSSSRSSAWASSKNPGRCRARCPDRSSTGSSGARARGRARGCCPAQEREEAASAQKTLQSIAVIGPNADDQRNQLGDYVPTTIPQHVVTILEGIKQMVSPSTKVNYVKGCDVIDGQAR